MDFFRNQFYLRPRQVLLHNLTFLRIGASPPRLSGWSPAIATSTS